MKKGIKKALLVVAVTTVVVLSKDKVTKSIETYHKKQFEKNMLGLVTRLRAMNR